MTKKTRYQKDVEKIYAALTDEQLNGQISKFWYSDISHEQGKLGEALEEKERRKNNEPL